MRKNLPVTDREFDYPGDRMLVSTTDLKGRIQYCNEAFIDVSGFSRDELIGKAHNVIRHPDMPEEAFADLWATLHAQRTWSAIVKNRRKDGDHYWVRANVTPMIDGNRATGYLSVRAKPTRDEIAAAEALYARMRAGTLRSHVLEGGRLVPSGWRGKLARLARLPIGLLGAACFATAPLVTWVAGLAAYHGTMPSAFWIACAAGAVPAACGAMWFQRVAQALGDTRQFAVRLAAGDLSTPLITGRADDFGELERALNQFRANLGALVLDVREQLARLKMASSAITESNGDLSERTLMQAASLEQTAATMEQLTSTVRGNAESSANALELSRQAQSTAAQGAEIATRVEETMSSIAGASNQIADITGVIDSIAFQTNLLALNAAVEAARAGENGRSFAVVAAEVRSLAQRSAASAQEIRKVVEKNVTGIRDGAALVSRTTAQMQAIDEAVQRVSDIIVQVANASGEQADGIGQVNQAVSQLDGATQKNAALVKQASATAQSLANQAVALDAAIQLFKVGN